jgi:hypothetical protein
LSIKGALFWLSLHAFAMLGKTMAKTVGLSCIEQQVLSQFEGRDAAVADQISFGALASAWKLGTVHQLVNALLTLVDKGLLSQCDVLSFCLTTKGLAEMKAESRDASQHSSSLHDATASEQVVNVDPLGWAVIV